MKTMVSGYIEADDDPTQREIQTDDKKRQSFTIAGMLGGLEVLWLGGLEVWRFGGFRVWRVWFEASTCLEDIRP